MVWFFSINKHGEFCGAWLGNPLAMEIDICQISELLLNFQKWSWFSGGNIYYPTIPFHSSLPWNLLGEWAINSNYLPMCPLLNPSRGQAKPVGTTWSTPLQRRIQKASWRRYTILVISFDHVHICSTSGQLHNIIYIYCLDNWTETISWKRGA